MLHRSFYIQGKSATIRFPVLPHFVSEKPLQFVFRIIHSDKFPYMQKYFFAYAEIYFCIYENFPAYIRKFPAIYTEISSL